MKGTASCLVQAFNLMCSMMSSLNKRGVEDNTKFEIVFLVHKQQAGCLLGTGGSLIQAIVAETRARIELSKITLPGSTEKSVTISGTQESVQAAGAWVIQQLEQNPLPAGTTNLPYKPPPTDMGGYAAGPPMHGYGNVHQQPAYDAMSSYYSQWGQYGSGAGAAAGYNPSSTGSYQGAQMSSPGYAQQAPSTAYNGQQAGYPQSAMGGGAYGVQQNSYSQQGMYGGMSTLGDSSGYQTGSQAQYGPPAPTDASGFPGQLARPDSFSGGNTRATIQFPIPTQLCPGLIGRGGSVIRGIFEASRASIKIADPVPGQKERIAYITGLDNQRNEALRLIQERLMQIATPRS